VSKRRGRAAGRSKPPQVIAPTVAGAAPGADAGAAADGGGRPPPSGAADAPAPEPTTPWGRARRFADRHPLLLSWIALAIGMVAILVYTSRDVGLQPSQLFAMIVATIALAGACVWIISWE
jgi:hypothetical protein